MPKVTVVLGPGVAEGEYLPSLEDVTSIERSCLNNSLKKLSHAERGQLKANVETLKDDVIKAADLLKSRRGRISAQISRLRRDLETMGSGADVIKSFFKLMADPIASCPEAEQTATAVKKATDRVLQQQNEINYRIAIAEIILGRLNGQIDETTAVLGVIDRIEYILN